MQNNINLRDKHFLEWPQEVKNELRDLLLERLVKAFPIKRKDILDILCTGSRVYVLPGNKQLFKETSDLDITIIIINKTFHKIFLPVNEMLASKLFIKKLMQTKEYKGKFRPKLTGFLFYGVKISVFIFDEKSKNLGNFLHGYKLPFYSLIRTKYVENNTRHLLDYETHVKTRINKYEYCFICLKRKESKNRLQFKLIEKGYVNGSCDEQECIKLQDIFICDECFNILFKEGFDYFLDLIHNRIVIKEKSVIKKLFTWLSSLFKEE